MTAPLLGRWDQARDVSSSPFRVSVPAAPYLGFIARTHLALDLLFSLGCVFAMHQVIIGSVTHAGDAWTCERQRNAAWVLSDFPCEGSRWLQARHVALHPLFYQLVRSRRLGDWVTLASCLLHTALACLTTSLLLLHARRAPPGTARGRLWGWWVAWREALVLAPKVDWSPLALLVPLVLLAADPRLRTAMPAYQVLQLHVQAPLAVHLCSVLVTELCRVRLQALSYVVSIRSLCFYLTAMQLDPPTPGPGRPWQAQALLRLLPLMSCLLTTLLYTYATEARVYRSFLQQHQANGQQLPNSCRRSSKGIINTQVLDALADEEKNMDLCRQTAPAAAAAQLPDSSRGLSQQACRWSSAVHHQEAVAGQLPCSRNMCNTCPGPRPVLDLAHTAARPGSGSGRPPAGEQPVDLYRSSLRSMRLTCKVSVPAGQSYEDTATRVRAVSLEAITRCLGNCAPGPLSAECLTLPGCVRLLVWVTYGGTANQQQQQLLSQQEGGHHHEELQQVGTRVQAALQQQGLHLKQPVEVVPGSGSDKAWAIDTDGAGGMYPQSPAAAQGARSGSLELVLLLPPEDLPACRSMAAIISRNGDLVWSHELLPSPEHAIGCCPLSVPASALRGDALRHGGPWPLDVLQVTLMGTGPGGREAVLGSCPLLLCPPEAAAEVCDLWDDMVTQHTSTSCCSNTSSTEDSADGAGPDAPLAQPGSDAAEEGSSSSYSQPAYSPDVAALYCDHLAPLLRDMDLVVGAARRLAAAAGTGQTLHAPGSADTEVQAIQADVLEYLQARCMPVCAAYVEEAWEQGLAAAATVAAAATAGPTPERGARRQAMAGADAGAQQRPDASSSSAGKAPTAAEAPSGQYAGSCSDVANHPTASEDVAALDLDNMEANVGAWQLLHGFCPAALEQRYLAWRASTFGHTEAAVITAILCVSFVVSALKMRSLGLVWPVIAPLAGCLWLGCDPLLPYLARRLLPRPRGPHALARRHERLALLAPLVGAVFVALNVMGWVPISEVRPGSYAGTWYMVVFRVVFTPLVLHLRLAALAPVAAVEGAAVALNQLAIHPELSARVRAGLGCAVLAGSLVTGALLDRRLRGRFLAMQRSAALAVSKDG